MNPLSQTANDITSLTYKRFPEYFALQTVAASIYCLNNILLRAGTSGGLLWIR